MNNNNQQNQKPAIFKTIHNQESKQFKSKLKQCLKLTSDALNDPYSKIIFGDRQPVICQRSSPNLGKMLTKSKFEQIKTPTTLTSKQLESEPNHPKKPGSDVLPNAGQRRAP